MLPWILAALLGAALGYAVRRLTPFLSRVKDEVPPSPRAWIEVLGALLFVLLRAELGFALPAAKWYLLLVLLLALTSADFRYKLLPDRITYPGTLLGVLCSALWPGDLTRFFSHEGILRAMGLGTGAVGGLVLALLGAAAAFLAFEAARRLMGLLAGMEAMGMGDSKLLMMLGAFLGPQAALFSLVPGLFCGLVLGVAYTRLFRSPHFPFGPALALGGILTLLYAERMVGFVGGLLEKAATLRGPGFVALQVLLLGTAVWLILRVRRRSREYTEKIEKDYERLDRKP